MKIYIFIFVAVIFIQSVNINAEDRSDDSTSSMHGIYGSYSMLRESSGTSWQADSTPYYYKPVKRPMEKHL